MNKLHMIDYEALEALLRQGEWKGVLEQRQLKEVEFAGMYRNQFAHGTTGHNQLIVIADLTHLLDYIVANYELVRKK